jgi:hypothetical protein
MMPWVICFNIFSVFLPGNLFLISDNSSSVSLEEIYCQVLTPVLRLLSSVIAHIGREHSGLLNRVIRLIISMSVSHVNIVLKGIKVCYYGTFLLQFFVFYLIATTVFEFSIKTQL